jgi:hypothetical protein
MGHAMALIKAHTGEYRPGWEFGNLKSLWLRKLSAALLLASLCACGGSKVTLKDPSIPEPLVEQLQMTVAVRYPAAFENFVHEEKVIGKEKWSIDLGRSNKLLFTQLFGSMFSDYKVIEEDTDLETIAFDALIEPTIDAFEFSVPSQSQTEEFAVWIRYRIKIFDNEGVQIANWPIPAYGKSQTSTFGGDEALRRAAVLAMRDAAALIIMQMDNSTGISKLKDATASRSSVPFGVMPETENVQTTAVEDNLDEPGT